MKNGAPKLLLGVFLTALSLTLALKAEGRAFDVPGRGPGPFVGERGGMFFQFLEKIVELKLTPDQQEKILGVLRKHREDFQHTMKKMAEAHQKLNDTIAQDNATESAIREAHKSVASAQEDLAVLRSKVRREVMSLLTDEQRGKVQAWLEERAAGPSGPGFMPMRPGK